MSEGLTIGDYSKSPIVTKPRATRLIYSWRANESAAVFLFNFFWPRAGRVILELILPVYTLKRASR